MARISDTIANFIDSLIQEEDDNEVIIQRNELADKFNCAPSQINYVLTTRFSCEKGYIIESRRGGGGYITIRKVCYKHDYERVELLINAIGNSITYASAVSILEHLLDIQCITEREIDIIKILISERTLTAVENKNRVRADMLRSMITVLLS